MVVASSHRFWIILMRIQRKPTEIISFYKWGLLCLKDTISVVTQPVSDSTGNMHYSSLEPYCFSVSWGDMFAWRKDRIKLGQEIVVAGARFSRSWGKPWWWSAQSHSIHLLLFSLNYPEDLEWERPLWFLHRQQGTHLRSLFLRKNEFADLWQEKRKALGPGLDPTCRLGLSRWFHGSTLLLKFCPGPPFLNFHISQHVTYPDLFISHET